MPSVNWISHQYPCRCARGDEICARQYVAADHGQRRWRLLGLGFSTMRRICSITSVIAWCRRCRSFGIFARHLLHPDHRTAVIVIDVHHLLHHRRLAVDQVVGQHHGEGLVAYRRIGAEHRMAQPQSFRLANVDAVDVLRQQVLHKLPATRSCRAGEFAFQLVGLVEMILDGALGTTGDEDHVGDAGSHRLLHRILDQRLVHDGHHLFGLALVAGRKRVPRPATGKTALVTFFIFPTTP